MKSRLIITGILVLLASLTLGYFSFFEASNDGEIHVELYDEDRFISETTIAFDEGDTLYDLLRDHFEITCMSASYERDPSCQSASFSSISGRIILEIESLTSNWVDSYIQIEVNGEKSSYGMDTLIFKDQDVITFRYVPLD